MVIEGLGRVFSVKGASKKLVLCEESVRRLARAGKLEARMIGNSWVIPAESIRNYLEGGK